MGARFAPPRPPKTYAERKEAFHKRQKRKPYKWGITREDIETKIRSQYNTFALPIEDDIKFDEIAIESMDNSVRPLEFYEQLRSRRQEKLAGLHRRFERLGSHAFSSQDIFKPDPDGKKSDAAHRLFTEHSFDALVDYWAAMLPGVDEDDQHDSPDRNSESPPYRTREEGPSYVPPRSPRIYSLSQLPPSQQPSTPPASPPQSNSGTSCHPATSGKGHTNSKRAPIKPKAVDEKLRRSSRIVKQPTQQYNVGKATWSARKPRKKK